MSRKHRFLAFLLDIGHENIRLLVDKGVFRGSLLCIVGNLHFLRMENSGRDKGWRKHVNR